MDLERDVLLEVLQGTRTHVITTLERSSADDPLTTSVLSRSSCLGLMSHVAREVEEFRFYDVADQPFDVDEFGSSSAASWWVEPAEVVASMSGEVSHDVTAVDDIWQERTGNTESTTTSRETSSAVASTR